MLKALFDGVTDLYNLDISLYGFTFTPMEMFITFFVLALAVWGLSALFSPD